MQDFRVANDAPAQIPMQAAQIQPVPQVQAPGVIDPAGMQAQAARMGDEQADLAEKARQRKSEASTRAFFQAQMRAGRNLALSDDLREMEPAAKEALDPDAYLKFQQHAQQTQARELDLSGKLMQQEVAKNELGHVRFKEVYDLGKPIVDKYMNKSGADLAGFNDEKTLMATRLAVVKDAQGKDAYPPQLIQQIREANTPEQLNNLVTKSESGMLIHERVVKMQKLEEETKLAAARAQKEIGLAKLAGLGGQAGQKAAAIEEIYRKREAGILSDAAAADAIKAIQGAAGRPHPFSLEGSDPAAIKQMAADIVAGKRPPLSAFRATTPVGLAINQEISRLDPEYDAKTYGVADKTMKGFATGPQGNTARALNVAVDHLGTLARLGNKLNNEDLQTFNRLGNLISRELGAPEITSFDGAKQVVAGEIVKAIIGGPGAAEDRKEARDHILSAASPEQLLQMINTYKDLMGGQLGGLRRQYVANIKGATDADFDKFLSQDAKRQIPGGAAKNPTPAGFPRVGEKLQGKNDTDAATILSEELATEKQKLAKATKQEDIDLAQKNIASIKKEAAERKLTLKETLTGASKSVVPPITSEQQAKVKPGWKVMISPSTKTRWQVSPDGQTKEPL